MLRKITSPLFNQSYIDTGDGHVVILLHGLFGNLYMWKPVVDALKDEYRVVVPRLPIFDLPIEHTNVKYLVKILRDYMEWNKFSDVTLVGHALGGQVALLYTHLYPADVKKLVLTGGAGLFENSPFLDSPPPEAFKYDYVKSKVKDAFYQKSFASDLLVHEVYATVQNIPKRLTLSTLARSSRQVGVSTFLNKIDQPVLMIWGLEDKITPPEVALHFHDFLYNSEIKFIKNSGHLPMLEQPDEFVTYLILFLKGVSKRYY